MLLQGAFPEFEKPGMIVGRTGLVERATLSISRPERRAPPTPEQYRTMVRRLLADRFKLKVRVERRPVEVYFAAGRAIGRPARTTFAPGNAAVSRRAQSRRKTCRESRGRRGVHLPRPATVQGRLHAVERLRKQIAPPGGRRDTRIDSDRSGSLHGQARRRSDRAERDLSSTSSSSTTGHCAQRTLRGEARWPAPACLRQYRNSSG